MIQSPPPHPRATPDDAQPWESKELLAARVSARRAATSVDARARGDVDVDVDGDDDVVDVFVAAMDGGGGSGSLANEVRARACIFGSSIARGRRGDRVEAALARGVERGWRPARARARDGAWGNLMGSSYPSGLRAKRGRRTRGDSCGTEGWW